MDHAATPAQPSAVPALPVLSLDYATYADDRPAGVRTGVYRDGAVLNVLLVGPPHPDAAGLVRPGLFLAATICAVVLSVALMPDRGWLQSALVSLDAALVITMPAALACMGWRLFRAMEAVNLPVLLRVNPYCVGLLDRRVAARAREWPRRDVRAVTVQLADHGSRRGYGVQVTIETTRGTARSHAIAEHAQLVEQATQALAGYLAVDGSAQPA